MATKVIFALVIGLNWREEAMTELKRTNDYDSNENVEGDVFRLLFRERFARDTSPALTVIYDEPNGKQGVELVPDVTPTEAEPSGSRDSATTSNVLAEEASDQLPVEGIEEAKGVVDLSDQGADSKEMSTDTRILATEMASWFIRRDNKWYDVDDPYRTLSRDDVEQISIHRFRARYPGAKLSKELIRSVFSRTMVVKHSDPTTSIPVWSGKQECRPNSRERLIFKDGMATLNTWKVPEYRTLGVKEADSSMFDEFLRRAVPLEADRAVIKAWFAWNLQNEADKPGWALILYSRRKGTGKSTLTNVGKSLFGHKNSMTQNNVSGLTGRFNLPILLSKFVVCEELKLTQDSSASNTVKTYITEKTATSESKGKDLQPIEQCCAFMFTTNHFPSWMEADERRYYVVDMDHAGHASGAEAAEFGAFVADFLRYYSEPKNVASLYNALMAYPIPNNFNAKALNPAQIDTPIMREIVGSSREVLLELLEEHLNDEKLVAVAQGELADVANRQFKMNFNRLDHLMRYLGWAKVKVKWGGVDYARVLYLRPGYAIDRGEVTGPDGFRQRFTGVGLKRSGDVVEPMEIIR